jgi:hypothetical protein
MMVFTWEFASGHLQVEFDYYKIMILSTIGMACSLLMNGDPWTGSWSKKVIEPQSSATCGIWDKELEGYCVTDNLLIASGATPDLELTPAKLSG